MLASRAATGMLDVLAIRVLYGPSGGLPVRGSVSFAELLQHLGHLVAALAAADVDDDVRVRPLGDLVLGHGLAGSESARDGSRAGPWRWGTWYR